MYLDIFDKGRSHLLRLLPKNHVHANIANYDILQKKIISLNTRLNEFEYGICIDNKKSAVNDFSYYKTQSPKQFEKNKFGVCWDYTLYEADYFDKYFHNIKYKLFLLLCGTEENIKNKTPEITHTFLAYTLQNKWYLFESCSKKHKGIRRYNSLRELLLAYQRKYWDSILDESQKHNRYKQQIFEFSNPKIYGLDIYEFMEYCMNGKRILI